MGALANYASVGLQTGFYNNQLKYDYYFFNCPLHKVLVVSFRKIWKLSLDRNTDRPTDRGKLLTITRIMMMNQWKDIITMMMNQLEVIMIMQSLKTMKVDKVVHCKKTERVKTPWLTITDSDLVIRWVELQLELSSRLILFQFKSGINAL